MKEPLEKERTKCQRTTSDQDEGRHQSRNTVPMVLSWVFDSWLKDTPVKKMNFHKYFHITA